MSHISKVTDVITLPARTAVGAARLGIRTTGWVLGWATEQVVGRQFAPSVSVPAPAAPVTMPVDAPVDDLPDSPAPQPTPDVDPMRATRTPPAKAPAKKAPAKKVPASEVPLKSAPTPSLTPALAMFDEADGADDVPEPTPIRARATKKAPAKKTAARRTAAKKTAAKKAATKKTAARKTAAKKAPSKKAAVLAPALGLSEAEVEETETPLVDPSTAGSVASETETLRGASDVDKG